MGLTDCRHTGTHTFASASATPYTVTLFTEDGDGGNDTETVAVTVFGDLPPAAADDEGQVDEDGVLEVPAPGLLGLVTDGDGDTVALVSTSTPEHGTWRPRRTAPGRSRPTPTSTARRRSPTPSRRRRAGHRRGHDHREPVNDAPTAGDRSATTPEDQSVTITPQMADVDGDALTLAVVTGPSPVGDGLGRLGYVPRPRLLRQRLLHLPRVRRHGDVVARHGDDHRDERERPTDRGGRRSRPPRTRPSARPATWQTSTATPSR